MKARLNTNNVLRLDGRSFFNRLLRFFPNWDYKFDQLCSGENIRNLNPVDKDHLKCNCTNGSHLIGVREPILYSLNKPPGCKNLFEPETVLCQKLRMNLL